MSHMCMIYANIYGKVETNWKLKTEERRLETQWAALAQALVSWPIRAELFSLNSWLSPPIEMARVRQIDRKAQQCMTATSQRENLLEGILTEREFHLHCQLPDAF